MNTNAGLRALIDCGDTIAHAKQYLARMMEQEMDMLRLWNEEGTDWAWVPEDVKPGQVVTFSGRVWKIVLVKGEKCIRLVK